MVQCGCVIASQATVDKRNPAQTASQALLLMWRMGWLTSLSLSLSLALFRQEKLNVACRSAIPCLLSGWQPKRSATLTSWSCVAPHTGTGHVLPWQGNAKPGPRYTKHQSDTATA